MLFTYLKRELGKRRRQTAVVATGLAIAIGLVVTVDAASAGVSKAQDTVLQSLYGIGTDISISKQGVPGDGGPQRFEVGGTQGQTSRGTRKFNRTRFEIARDSAVISADEVKTVAKTSGVAGYTTSLKLNSVTFNGQLPDFMQNQNTQQGQGNLPGSGSQGGATTGGNQSNSSPQPRPTGGFDGNGGSAFDITQFSVEGVETSVTAIGPMSSVTVSDGRLLNKEDIGQQNAVVDSAYATTNKIAVGDSISIASKKFTVVGIAQSTSTGANTASNVYIPIDVAQKLSGHTDEVTNVYVKANSAETVSTLDSALTKALPSMQVNSTSELASSVSGTLSSASSLIQDLGKWLSVIVLIVAFAIGALLTSSGVNRRTREFGTLKAIGWRSSRIVRQVMAESLATGFIGGIAGIGVGAAGVAAINHFAPTLTAQLAVAQQGFGPNGPNGGPGGFRGPGEAAQSISVVLNAVLSPSILLIALLLSILGGLVAGVFGGWRASRLSPAESLRSVA